MMLRVSVESEGGVANLSALTGAAPGAASGVAHGAELVRFAEAVLGGDDAELLRAREALLAAVGAEAFVEAAGVVSNFQRMVRIADATGIPLDAPVAMLTQDLRQELGLSRFGSGANTPPVGRISRAVARLMRPLAFAAARRYGRSK
jgi:hypothetical protein